jgi:hypothetical protein
MKRANRILLLTVVATLAAWLQTDRVFAQDDRRKELVGVWEGALTVGGVPRIFA